MDPLMQDHAGFEKPVAKEGPLGLYKARVREAVPWIVSPLKSMHGKEIKTFYVRHEASMLELFFDLCFVANLSTFTAYHEITSSDTVAAYIGFFLILWSTWFQITIFDVRFASDSVYERLCKLYQFMAFIVFAAGGAFFEPGEVGSNEAYRMYQLISIVLGITRIFLAIQYAIVAFFVVPKFRQLWLPFTLIIVTFLISGAVMFAAEAGFTESVVSKVHIVWWVILPVELIIIVAISSFWRMLSFKETHMTERLFLLTMIIIGEGVIGLTKISGKLWPPDSAPPATVVVSLLSVVLLLFLLWQAYFDCNPHGHYGTIKQQWWALAHFFLHLGYVGVVEGSNRMAVFSYSLTKVVKIQTSMDKLCANTTLANSAFVKYVNATMQDVKLESYNPRSYDTYQEFFANLTNPKIFTKSICANVDSFNEVRFDIYLTIRDAVLDKFGIKPAKTEAFFHTFRVTFAYYFGSVCLMMMTSVAFLYIVRRSYHDRYEFMRMGWRVVIALVTFGLIFLYFNENVFLSFVMSPYVVGTVCVLMGSTILIDRLCLALGQRTFRRKYQVPPPDSPNRHDSLGADSIVLQNFEAAGPKGGYGHVRTTSVEANEFSRLRPAYVSAGSEESTFQHTQTAYAPAQQPLMASPGISPGQYGGPTQYAEPTHYGAQAPYAGDIGAQGQEQTYQTGYPPYFPPTAPR